jgi:hypothetical protein
VIETLRARIFLRREGRSMSHVASRSALVLVACSACFGDPPELDERSTTDDGTSESTGASMHVIGQLVPAADRDDGAIFPGPMGREWFPSGEDMMGCQYSGEGPQEQQLYYAYLRFALPEALPAGTQIDDATLVLYGHTTFMWTASDALRVWIEDSADAREITGVQDFPGELVGLAHVSVRWPEDGGLAWRHPGTNDTPDLSPLLQRVVDENGGLAAGAHVQLWIAADAPDGVGTEVAWLDSIAGLDTAPTLTITLAP